LTIIVVDAVSLSSDWERRPFSPLFFRLQFFPFCSESYFAPLPRLGRKGLTTLLLFEERRASLFQPISLPFPSFSSFFFFRSSFYVSFVFLVLTLFRRLHKVLLVLRMLSPFFPLSLCWDSLLFRLPRTGFTSGSPLLFPSLPAFLRLPTLSAHPPFFPPPAGRVQMRDGFSSPGSFVRSDLLPPPRMSSPSSPFTGPHSLGCAVHVHCSSFLYRCTSRLLSSFSRLRAPPYGPTNTALVVEGPPQPWTSGPLVVCMLLVPPPPTTCFQQLSSGFCARALTCLSFSRTPASFSPS